MPLQKHMTLISIDDHLIEPAGLRVDRGRVRTNEGQTYPTLALTAVAERRTR